MKTPNYWKVKRAASNEQLLIIIIITTVFLTVFSLSLYWLKTPETPVMDFLSGSLSIIMQSALRYSSWPITRHQSTYSFIVRRKAKQSTVNKRKSRIRFLTSTVTILATPRSPKPNNIKMIRGIFFSLIILGVQWNQKKEGDFTKLQILKTAARSVWIESSCSHHFNDSLDIDHHIIVKLFLIVNLK